VVFLEQLQHFSAAGTQQLGDFVNPDC
jgi:hypothetical protein